MLSKHVERWQTNLTGSSLDTLSVSWPTSFDKRGIIHVLQEYGDGEDYSASIYLTPDEMDELAAALTEGATALGTESREND